MWSSFQRQPGGRPLVYAHRGARLEAPENSLCAFRLAVAQGADGIELDVRMTSDGALIVSHDDEIVVAERSQPLRLSRLSEAQVRRLRTTGGEPIASLKEVLQFAKVARTRLNIELKSDVPAPYWMARAAARLVEQSGLLVLFSSFHPGQIAELRRQLPRMPVALLTQQSRPKVSLLLGTRALGQIARHPNEGEASAGFIRKMKRTCPVINVWTVNDRARALALEQTAIDGVITDDPQTIVRLFQGASGVPPLTPASYGAVQSTGTRRTPGVGV